MVLIEKQLLIVVSKEIILEALAEEILRIYLDFTSILVSKQIIPEELTMEIRRIYHDTNTNTYKYRGRWF